MFDSKTMRRMIEDLAGDDLELRKELDMELCAYRDGLVDFAGLSDNAQMLMNDYEQMLTMQDRRTVFYERSIRTEEDSR